MMSQLLVRLQQRLDSATDPVERAEITAKIASNLARTGRFDDAKQKVSELRQQFGGGSSGRATVWIMLAEGLIYHYEDLSPLALDRISRALFLGTAMKYTAIVSVASAWKAHIEFELSKFDSMIQSLEIARANFTEVDHDAQTRVAMVLCNCYLICGNRNQAQKWFMHGRDHALKNGDQASIEAMLYNRAAFGLALIRAERCVDRAEATDLHLARREIQSARNLQDLTHVVALENHIHLWDARLLLLEEQFEKAIDQLRSVSGKSPFAGHNFSQAMIDLEVSFCLLYSGRAEEAEVLSRTIDPRVFEGLDVDEQLVAAWMRWKMSETDGRFGDPVKLQTRLNELRGSYAQSREALAAQLSQFEQA